MAISTLPNCQSNAFHGGCLTENQFNAMTHLDRKMNCDPKLEIDYKKIVLKEILNCGMQRSDLSELMDLFGSSTPKEVEATQLWQRIMCNINFNVHAAHDVEGASGAPVTLVFGAMNHANYGKDTPVMQGFELYHYRTNQTYTVTASKNTTSDFAHSVQMVSFQNKPTDIRQGDAFFVSSARTIGKVACSIAPSTALRETGYLIKSSPIRIEESYCFETSVEDFGQREVYTFPLLDQNGNQHEYWEPLIKADKRLSMERAKTIKFLLGSKIENPNHPLYNDEFSGFDGYVNRIKYGGGRYVPISMTGITSVEVDKVEAAARGYGITEFTWVMPHTQRVNFERNMQPLFNNTAGACTFQTFERAGVTKEDVIKLGITSFSQNGFTHHIKTAKWADYPEMLGNDFLKHSIFVMPTYGTRDPNGRIVPTFEFFKPVGVKGVDKTYFEQDDDLRTRTPFCEKIEGVMRQVLWMNINCINQHWLFEPKADY